MTKHILKASIRTILGRKVKSLRKQGLIPAVVYGKKAKTANLQIDAKIFAKLHTQVGESTLIYLHIEGEKEDRPVLIRTVTVDSVSDNLLHVDFHQVDLHEKVRAAVPVKVVGESPAEKEHLGILVSQIDEIEVEALPTEMPENFEVDVSVLTEINQAILVGDIKVSFKVVVLTNPEQIVVKIEPLAKEEAKEEVPVVVEEAAPIAEGEIKEPKETLAPAS